MRNERQIKQFIQRVEDATECFKINKDGFLESTVNTRYTIETYKVKVSFSKKTISVRTTLPFYLDENTAAYYSVKEYIDSLKGIDTGFYITKDYHFCCCVSCSIDDFYSLENPYDFLFLGIETINEHANEILSAFCCKQTIYMTMHI